MGKVSIAGAGGTGVGSDECTALKDDILKGTWAITADSDDEVVEGTLELTGDVSDSQVLEKKTYYNKDAKVKRTGTMPNCGAVSTSLNAGGSYTIPAGYHNGSGKVTANGLASQTPGNVATSDIISGKTAWVNGNKVTGTMPIQGADVSGTDRAGATNISCWEGTVCLGVRNAHYLNGVNWIQGNIPNFYAGNIKKGVNIGGIVGTFEGYVPTATDLYLRGNNVSNWHSNTSDMTLDSGQITIKANSGLVKGISTGVAINLSGRNYINIEGYLETSLDDRYWAVTLLSDNTRVTTTATTAAGNYIRSIPLAAMNKTSILQLSGYGLKGAVYRIWLS